ncbi:MAG: pseudouridine synthase [Pseudomonadota bacterium]
MPRKPRVTYASRRQHADAKPNPVGRAPRSSKRGEAGNAADPRTKTAAGAGTRPSAKRSGERGDQRSKSARDTGGGTSRDTATGATKSVQRNSGPQFKKRGASATKKSVIARAAARAATSSHAGAATTGTSKPSNKPARRRPRAPTATGPQKFTARTATHKTGPSVTTPMRIAKAIARAGLCSRRDAERWIDEGRVRVNGKVLTSAALEVGPKDRILVDNEPLPAAEPPRLWRLHKERGTVTTAYDPEGRPTVFANLPADLPRVIAIGRLDYNTEGLLLLTNDGELARHLELPATGWMRRYRVRARGRIGQTELNALKEGITVDGINYGPVEATVDTASGANQWLNVGLREGKNREVRKVLAHLKLEVNRLIRVSYGPFQLHDLPPGQVEHVRRKTLIDQLGTRTAKSFGLSEDDEDVSEQAAQRPWQRPSPRKSDNRKPASRKATSSKPLGQKTPSRRKPAPHNSGPKADR